MSRKNIHRKSTRKEKTSKDWPLVVYLWIFGLAFLGYVTARIGLESYPHPIHWLSGLAGGMIGIGVGWLWYRWKGDVI